MKQTPREKDIPDRLFLRKLLEAQGVRLEPPPHDREARKPGGLRQWLVRLFGGGG
jgi:hypothetical protein